MIGTGYIVFVIFRAVVALTKATLTIITSDRTKLVARTVVETLDNCDSAIDKTVYVLTTASTTVVLF